MPVQKIGARGWHLEHRDAGHFKFYTVIITDNGVVVTHWGRIGTVGQAQISQQGSRSAAESTGLHKIHEKHSKGYEYKVEELHFTLDDRDIEGALGEGRARPDPKRLTLLFDKAMRDPKFTGEKEGVLGNYEVFIKKAEGIMTSARDGVLSFDSVMNDYDELEAAWKEIEDRHSIASTTVNFAKQMVAQAMLSGKL